MVRILRKGLIWVHSAKQFVNKLTEPLKRIMDKWMLISENEYMYIYGKTSSTSVSMPGYNNQMQMYLLQHYPTID